jgi:phosphoribosylglycinamide formyltransferase-1
VSAVITRGQRVRTAVLISGRGSNLAALLAAAADPAYPAEITLVLSNRPDAPGLTLARDAGVRTVALAHADYESRKAFDRAMHGALEAHGTEFIAMAGFMRLLSPWFCAAWQGRLINIHPALLPSFRGLDTHARALAAGVKIHGCTVHHVVPEVDAGPIIGQAAVPVLPDDTEATLAARVLAAEHRLYPLALARVTGKTMKTEPDQPFLLAL